MVATQLEWIPRIFREWSVGGEGTVQLLQNDSRLDVFLQTIQEIENVDSWLQLKEHCNEATWWSLNTTPWWIEQFQPFEVVLQMYKKILKFIWVNIKRWGSQCEHLFTAEWVGDAWRDYNSVLYLKHSPLPVLNSNNGSTPTWGDRGNFQVLKWGKIKWQ